MGADRQTPDQNSGRDEADAAPTAGDNVFPIVAVGASAGGLRAFEAFFDSLPARPGMAFVLVQHLDPHHDSELAQILQNHTEMPVSQIQDRETIRPNRVYVIPPGRSLAVDEGVLQLSEPAEPRGQRAPIDLFFRSLAADQGANAVCVILSGSGSDGTLGLKRIKELGGVVLVQAPEDAEYDSMPRSAIQTGVVDLVAPVGELARKLVEYRKSARQIDFPGAGDALDDEEAGALRRIFTQLKSRTGADFSYYKRATVLRRLQRRLQVTQTEDLGAYLERLRRDEDEARALFKDLLISVTNFFRDEDAWQTLAREVIPALFEGKDRSDTIRVWVPGCATGEEAFTLGMLLMEEKRRHKDPPALQVFASDLDADAIRFARRGLYPQAISADVSPERLARFFEKESDGYRVRPELQEIVLFAEHNLVKDAPFAHLALISCRNLLIYLEPRVQTKVFQIFRYALGEDGYLFLGSSEGADRAGALFETVSKQARIYKARPGQPRLPHLPPWAAPLPVAIREAPETGAALASPSLGEVHRELMLAHYGPPSVLVDREHTIRYKFGDVGRYLRHFEGEPSLNLLDNVVDEMRVELRTGLYAAFRRGEAPTPRWVRLAVDGEPQRIGLRIEPVPSDKAPVEPLALVIFEPLPLHGPAARDGQGDRGEPPALVEQLEASVKELRHRLQTTVEEYETSNEELKSSNEELMSMNEELRSATQELETSREELRSTNEELTSLNQELNVKIEELKRSNSDLENLIAATNIATLFLDRDLCLKRYTPEATGLFHIIPADIGRPFSHISHEIDRDNLPELAAHVLETLETVEREVGSDDGRWFLLEMRPYRTVDDKIDGVVVTLVEITSQVAAERAQRLNAQRHAAVAALGHQALQASAVPDLLELAVRQVAETLDVPVAHIFTQQLAPAAGEEGELLLEAAVGWKPADVGSLTIPAVRLSRPEFALASGSDGIDGDRRFEPAEALAALGVQSGLSAVIRGPDGLRGVLGAYCREPRQFEQQELDFLHTVANVLGSAIASAEAGKALRDSQQRLAVAVKASAAGVYEHAVPVTAGSHLYHSPRWAEILGYSLEELPPAGAFMAWLRKQIHPDDVGRLDRAYTQFVEGEIPRYEVEARMRHKDGHWLWVRDFSEALERDDAGRVTRLAGMLFDIDRQRRVQGERELLLRQLQEERGRLQTILQQLPAGVVIAGAPGGELILGNERVEEIWQRPFAAVNSLDAYLAFPAFHLDGRPLAAEEWPLARAINHGERVTGEEIAIERGDGERRVISNSAAPIYDEAGEIAAGVVIFIDVTERKEMEAERDSLVEELRLLTATLEERVQERTVALEERSRQLSAVASALTVAEQRERERISQILHDDLQQLIHAAQLRVLMLDDELQGVNADVAETVGELEWLNDRALAVARSLTVELSPPVLEGEGLEEAFGWLAGHMEETYGLRVQIDVEDEVRPASEDLRELAFQMVRELLFNVVKHADVDRARLRLRREGEHCAITVSDEGNGFDSKLLKQWEASGSAYGLHSIRERLDLFEGALTIDTAPGAGTRVTMTVPCRQIEREGAVEGEA